MQAKANLTATRDFRTSGYRDSQGSCYNLRHSDQLPRRAWIPELQNITPEGCYNRPVLDVARTTARYRHAVINIHHRGCNTTRPATQPGGEWEWGKYRRQRFAAQALRMKTLHLGTAGLYDAYDVQVRLCRKTRGSTAKPAPQVFPRPWAGLPLSCDNGHQERWMFVSALHGHAYMDKVRGFVEGVRLLGAAVKPSRSQWVQAASGCRVQHCINFLPQTHPNFTTV
jgi:hypothetical protein